MAAVLALILASCSAGPDRSEVVGHAVEEGLVPLLEEGADAVAILDTATTAFCSVPDESSLQAAQSAWVSAERAWEATDVAIFYGPADMLRTESKVDFEPISEEGIEDLLASDANIDVDYVENRSAASRRGLGAVEYLLFRPLDAAAESRSCQLATAAASVAARSASELAAAWTESQEPFVEEMVTAMDANDALADMVGAQYEILNRQTLFELGKALGVTAPEADLEALPEGDADAGALRYRSQLEGIETVLNVGDEQSLLSLIRSRSDDVADDIESALESAAARLDRIDGPMREAVVDDPDEMTGLLNDLSELRDLIHVEVVSLLDLTLGFSDSDGDSG